MDKSDEPWAPPVDERPFRGLFMLPPEVGFPFHEELVAMIHFLEFIGSRTYERPDVVKNPASRIVANEFARCASTYYAVMSLALDGCGVQADLLTRPMLEGLTSASWAHRNPDAAGKRYRLHEKYVAKLYSDKARDLGFILRGAPEEGIHLTAEELAEAIALFGRYGERSWTGLKPWQLAEEWLETIADPTKRDVAARQIEMYRATANWTMHSTPIGAARHLEPYDDQYMRAIIGPSDLGVRNALVNAFNFFASMAELTEEHFEMGFAEELRREIHSAATIVGAPPN